MGVYIDGMEMPTIGRILITLPSGRTLEVSADSTQNILREAKAVPVPEHGDLVDRDEMREIAISLLNEAVTDQEADAIREMWSRLGQMPVYIPAEEEKTKESLCLNCQSKTCWNEGFDTGVHNCKAYSPYQSDTNYSRIRSLSIYEMADELQVLIDEAVWSGEGKSNNELLEWLQSPAEEGE